MSKSPIPHGPMRVDAVSKGERGPVMVPTAYHPEDHYPIEYTQAFGLMYKSDYARVGRAGIVDRAVWSEGVNWSAIIGRPEGLGDPELYLFLDGSRIMTGLLTLAPLDPIEDDQATRKLYVDVADQLLADADQALRIYVDDADRVLQDQIDLLVAGQIFVGSYDVANNYAEFTSASGATSGPLPLASDFVLGSYLIVVTPGMGPPPAPSEVFNVGDRIFSDGAQWQGVHVAPAQATAAVVAMLPEINQWTDVQEAIEGLWTGKINKTGDVMSGPLYLPGITFVSPDEAVSKAYVDMVARDCVQKIGDTMSGTLGIATSGNNIPLVVSAPGLGIPAIRAFRDVLIDTGDLVLATDGMGITLNTGRIYKAVGTGLVIRQAGGAQLQVEDNNGTNRRVVLDANNGVRKSGDTMTGALGVNVAGQGAGAILIYSSNAANQDTPALYWQRWGGSNLGDIRFRWNGYQGYGGTEAGIYIMHGCGGYGYQAMLYNPGFANNDLTFTGNCRAPSFINTSDIALKRDVADVDAIEALKAFDSLRPIRFRHALERVPDELSATGYVEKPTPLSDDGRLHWGFLANEIDAPDAVFTSEGRKGYDIAQLLAITVSALKEQSKTLKEQNTLIDQIRAQATAEIEQVAIQLAGAVNQIALLGEQLATLEERFANKVIADMETQVARMREAAVRPNQVHRPPPLPDK